MKIGVVIFPGSNCDRDIIHVLKNVFKKHVDILWHKQNQLPNYSSNDCIILPGGFSYGDYLRTGAIARFSPIMKEVITHANKGGKVIGICNGFQILCEANLLPGILVRNENQQFICENTYIRSENSHSVFTASLNINSVYNIPIAHAEGRYFANEDVLKSLEENQQIIFKYCSKNGEIDEEHNPNGSLLNIAGICNKEGTVAGMMPHPERACEKAVNNQDGKAIINAIFEKLELIHS